MDGSSLGPSEQLEAFRPYLLLLARQQLNRALQAKIDPSGVVNLTLQEAGRGFATVRDHSHEAQLRWLRRILARNLIDETRAYCGPVRDAAREVSIEAELDASSGRLACCLAADQTSPSQRAERNEDLLRLSRVLLELPEEQRLAVEYHHLQGLSLAETAAQLDKTKAAAAGLVFRGLNKLREMLAEGEG